MPGYEKVVIWEGNLAKHIVTIVRLLFMDFCE